MRKYVGGILRGLWWCGGSEGWGKWLVMRWTGDLVFDGSPDF